MVEDDELLKNAMEQNVVEVVDEIVVDLDALLAYAYRIVKEVS